jgi:hypothetical protein
MITFYSPRDLEVDEEFDMLGCAHCADSQDLCEAFWLYLFLTHLDGISLINNLRTNNNLIVLCQIAGIPGVHDFVRVVLSGQGLMLQSGYKGEISENSISCLFTCYTLRRKTIKPMLFDSFKTVS